MWNDSRGIYTVKLASLTDQLSELKNWSIDFNNYWGPTIAAVSSSTKKLQDNVPTLIEIYYSEIQSRSEVGSNIDKSLVNNKDWIL